MSLKRTAWTLGVVLALALCGAALAEDRAHTEIRAADAACDQHTWSSYTALAQCYNISERELWVKYAPTYLPLFDGHASRRLDIAGQTDSHALTVEMGRAAERAEQAAFDDQVSQLADATNRQKQERDDEAAARVRRAIAEFAQSQAAAAAARAQQNQTQHTTCQTILNQLDCTTRSW